MDNLVINHMLYDGVTAQKQLCRIRLARNCIEIGFADYGDNASEDGHGSPLVIEKYNGKLRVIVFSDINTEEPTHVIDMQASLESNRQQHDTT